MPHSIEASQKIIQAIQKISAPKVEPQKEPDVKTKQEEQTLDLEKASLEVEGIRQDLEQRKNYADKIFTLVVVWLISILGLLIAQGMKGIYLSENVLITIIGGTTVNVLGIFVIVANYIFHRPGPK